MHKIILIALAVVGSVGIVGCSTHSPSKNPTVSQTRPYANWTNAQLQSKRTQLMIEDSKPDLKIDPVNGGSYVPRHKGQNREIEQINAELLRRDPSGKLLVQP